MATDLTLYGRPVHTVFDLLGDKENDITYSLGWALSRSDRLTRALLEDVLGAAAEDPDRILLQEGISGAGFTDIEIFAGKCHLILEAKRGWNLPTIEQLKLYAERRPELPTVLLVSAEASPEYATRHLPISVADVPVAYRSWRQIAALAWEVAQSGSHAEKRLLRELVAYLRGLMTMQRVDSNLVYVVSLGGQIEDTDLTFRDVVVEHDTYFCPFGGRGGWPKLPPNYLGFRFNGQLQRISHVENYEVNDEAHVGFEPLRGKVNWSGEPHWLFELGPVIKPPHEVRTGNIFRNARVWAALDLLLTCQTIAEARDKTRERLEAAGESVE